MKRGVRLASLFLISLIFLSFLVIVVSAVDPDPNVPASGTAAEAALKDKTNVASGSVAGAFSRLSDRLFGSGESSWAKGDGLQTGTSKFLLTILIALVVFSIMSMIPGLDKISGGDYSWLGFVFAGIVGYLSMAYITPEEIVVIMTSYSGMGFTIAILIPFLVLFAFSISISMKNQTPSQQVFSEILAQAVWGFFAAYVLYKTLVNIDKFGDMELLLSLVLAIAAIIMAVYGARKLIKVIQERRTQATAGNARQTEFLATEVTMDRAAAARLEAEDAAQRLAIVRRP